MAALAGLRPHIARSLALATRLQRQKADAMTLGLNVIGAPAAVLQASGRILSANDLFLSLQKSISTRARDRIVISDERTNRLLYKALAWHAVGSFPSPAVRTEPASSTSYPCAGMRWTCHPMAAPSC